MSTNPFFAEWTAPYGLPPFALIRPEHYPPAFDRGMAAHDAEIAAIAGSAEPPSFANTIAALERAGRLLERVSRVFFNLEASDTNDALESIARDYAPKLAKHQTRVRRRYWRSRSRSASAARPSEARRAWRSATRAKSAGSSATRVWCCASFGA